MDPAPDAAGPPDPTDGADGKGDGFSHDGLASDGLAGDYDPEVLAALDAWSERPDQLPRPLPSRLVSWQRRSLVGAVMTGWALGIREVLEPKRDEQIIIEVDADGEPHDLPIRLLLDPDDPSGSLCIVRRDPPPPVV